MIFKYLLALVIFVLIVVFYLLDQKNELSEIPSFENFYEKSFSFELPDTIGTYLHIQSVESEADSLIFIAERISASNYRLNKNTRKFRRFTKYGLGPGEMQMPESILNMGDHIVLTGSAKPALLKYDFNGNYLSEEKQNYSFGLKRVFKNGNDIYKFNTVNSSTYFDRVADGYKFYEIPSHIRQVSGIHKSHPGAFVYDDTLFFMNRFEAKIHKYDLQNDSVLSSVNVKGINTNGYNIKSTKNTYSSVETYGGYEISNFQKILINNELYFYISFFKNLNGEKDSQSYIYDKDLKKVAYVDTSKYGELVHTSNNKLIFLKVDFESLLTTINEYQFKNDVLLLDQLEQ